MNKKYNRTQGLFVKYGLNPLGIYSVPVSNLIKKLEPHRVEKSHFSKNVIFPELWEDQFQNSKHYTDKDFTYSYDYDRHTKSDVYCIAVDNEKYYFSKKATEPRYKVGETIDVEKTNSINTSSYKINFTIKISMLRGYVDLSILDLMTEEVIFEEKEVYFKSITKQGLEKEIQKFVFGKLGY